MNRRGRVGGVTDEMTAMSGEGEVSAGAGAGALPLNAAERESIDLMVNLASAVGLPRSVAEIYGLLFVSVEPLSLDDLMERVGLSRGSASQGLRALRNLGAVEPVVRPGDRRTYYKAETRLKVLISGFIREQVLPRVEGWPQRLAHLREAAEDVSDGQRRVVESRLRQLDGWARKTRRLTPLIMNFLGK